MRVDITSHSNFEAAFEKCLDLYNGIDVLVNNAGVDGEINWESQLQINFMVKNCRLLLLLCICVQSTGFQKLANLAIFGIFNELLSIQM